MPVILTRHDIITALPKVQVGLNKYLWLQGQVAAQLATFHADPLFQRKYNGFYRVQGRDTKWRTTYYDLMGQAAAHGLTFFDILDALYKTTGRVEASFASKMFATLNPNAPVIDAWVLLNTGHMLPALGTPNRLQGVDMVHGLLGSDFAAYLATPDGSFLVAEFTRRYGSHVTPEKMLDLVLWQTRPPKSGRTGGAARGKPGAALSPTASGTSAAP